MTEDKSVRFTDNDLNILTDKLKTEVPHATGVFLYYTEGRALLKRLEVAERLCQAVWDKDALMMVEALAVWRAEAGK